MSTSTSMVVDVEMFIKSTFSNHFTLQTELTWYNYPVEQNEFSSPFFILVSGVYFARLDPRDEIFWSARLAFLGLILYGRHFFRISDFVTRGIGKLNVCCSKFCWIKWSFKWDFFPFVSKFLGFFPRANFSIPQNLDCRIPESGKLRPIFYFRSATLFVS